MKDGVGVGTIDDNIREMYINLKKKKISKMYVYSSTL